MSKHNGSIVLRGRALWVAGALVAFACDPGAPEVERAARALDSSFSFNDAPGPFAASRFIDIPAAVHGDLCTVYADQTATCPIGQVRLGSRGVGPTAELEIVLDSSAFVDPSLRPSAISCGTACFLEVPALRASGAGYEVISGREITFFAPSGAGFAPAVGHAVLTADALGRTLTLLGHPLDRSRLVFAQPSGCGAWYLSEAANDFGTIELLYDGCRLIGLSNASGDAVTISWGPGSLVISRSWDFDILALTFDAEGRLSSAMGPAAADGAIGAEVSWRGGRFTAIRPTGLPPEQLTYSPGGLVTTLVSSSGDAYAIDHRGAQVAVGSGAMARTMTYTADAGRVSAIRFMDGSSATYTHTPSGLIETVELDGVVTYTYNAFGDLTAVTGPYGYSQSTTYTGYGAVSSYATSYEPLTTWTRDANGFVVAQETADGLLTSFERDTNGLLTRVIYPTVPVTQESFVYDAYGELVSSTDTLGRTTLSDYDPLGRLAQETDFLGRTTNITRSTSASGTVTHISSPFGSVQISTDPYGRLVQRTLSFGGLAAEEASFTHAPAGPASMAFGPSTELATTYDESGAPSEISLNGAVVQHAAAVVATATTANIVLWP